VVGRSETEKAMDEAMSGALQLIADGSRFCDEESRASLGRSCRD